jgi:predicted DNA-binding protein YlxM (UPF0122 family)
VDNFVEEVIPRMTTKQFRQHFRMNPHIFEDLLRKLYTIYPQVAKAGNQELDLEKQVLLCIWYIANLESFRSVADRFGISKSTAWSSFYKTCLKILELNRRFLIIAWPGMRQALRNVDAFERKANFPGIIGAIDGTHIPIKSPALHQSSYINRNGYHSILLQGVCDTNLKFIDCYTGEAGSLHDSSLFRRSDLSVRLPTLQIPENSHLVGDSAYTLQDRLMVPFKNNGHLTQEQINYNTAHSKSRIVIERCFGLLKGRFRKLKLVEAMRMELIPIMIFCACVLHNVCILNADNGEDIDIDNEVREEHIMNPRHEEENVNLNPDARRKRDRIARLFR